MKVDKTAISFYNKYCDGYGAPGSTGNGYVSVLKVSVGKIKKTDDILIDGIVAYDKAEVNDAYIGQINMLTASSFCGVAGQIWGYDLAKHDSIVRDEEKPVLEMKQYDGSILKVFDAKPLLDAGVELFGTESERRYPPLPGAHMICANKGVTAYRPLKEKSFGENEGYGVWCFIAISIAKDREKNASLFIEDAGIWKKSDKEEELKEFLENHRKSVVWSVIECGRDSHITYDRTYVGFAYTIMKPGEIGTSLTCAPYVTLARDAIPENGFGELNKMSLSEWLKDQKFQALK